MSRGRDLDEPGCAEPRGRRELQHRRSRHQQDGERNFYGVSLLADTVRRTGSPAYRSRRGLLVIAKRVPHDRRHPPPSEDAVVDQETTRQEPRIPLLYGWLGSFTLHVFLLLGFPSLFPQALHVSKEPFHWDVALVQTIPTAHESVQTADAPQSVVPKQPDRTPTSPHIYRTIRYAPPERIASRAPKTDAPVTSPSEVATTAIPNELPSTLNQITELPRQPTEPLAASTTQEPSIQEAAATLGEENRPPTEIARPALATVSDATVVSVTRPDYGWLQQAIFRRLEELKRSSHPLLDESRPLKVTVKAVVSNEGLLLDSTIVKSSGLDRIDQEAIALVQRVFPLQLDRSLDRRQIVMRIPISYSQE